MQQKYTPDSRFSRTVDSFERSAIALILGLMTVITFVNVVLRYGFNTSLIWGLEVVLILFAWLVLFGVSYAFKITAHLGVDALIAVFPSRGKRIMGLISAALCLLYTVFLLKGAWDYWAPFAALEQTSGRWFPTGFVPTRDRAFYVTDQVPMPEIFRWLEGLINQGEAYEKLPRVVPYTILPVGVALMLFRILQVTLRIIRGEQDSLIVSHEAEEAVEEAAARNAEV